MHAHPITLPPLCLTEGLVSFEELAVLSFSIFFLSHQLILISSAQRAWVLEWAQAQVRTLNTVPSTSLHFPQNVTRLLFQSGGPTNTGPVHNPLLFSIMSSEPKETRKVIYKSKEGQAEATVTTTCNWPQERSHSFFEDEFEKKFSNSDYKLFKITINEDIRL